MTSFIAASLSLLGHLPETVTAVLATTRPLTNCSIVPVMLSNDDIWDALCAEPRATIKQRAYLKLFSTFSDTMQFTEKLRFEECLEAPFANQVLQDLIDNKRYFKSGVKHIDFVNRDSVKIATAAPLTNLRTVDLNRCIQLKDAEFKLLCAKFPLLERLEMNFYDEQDNTDRFDITEDGAAAIGNLTNLTELDLEMLEDEMSTMLKFSTLKKLKKLRKLSIDRCEEFTDETFDIDDEEDEDEQEGEPALYALRELKIECEDEITDATFDFLERHAPNLSSFHCLEIELSGIRAVSKLTNLSTLILEEVESFSEDDIKSIATNLTKLEKFRMCCNARQNFDVVFEHISQSTAPLRALEVTVYNVMNLTGKGLLALTALKSLEKLTLETVATDNNIDENFFCDGGDDGRCFPQSLKHLQLSGFDRLNGEMMTSMMKPLSLCHLELSRCSKRLTSEGLKQALENNTNSTKSTLEVLILSECTGLKNLCFLEGLTNLKELDLSKTKLDFSLMRERTETGFNLLPASTLESLNLSETYIEDDDVVQFSVEALVKNQKLKHLDLSQCLSLKEKSLDEVVSKLMSLQFLNLKGWNLSSRSSSGGEASRNDLLTKAFVSVFEKLPKLSEFKIEHSLLIDVTRTPEQQRKARQVNVMTQWS